jgi:hypothetical protein
MKAISPRLHLSNFKTMLWIPSFISLLRRTIICPDLITIAFLNKPFIFSNYISSSDGLLIYDVLSKLYLNNKKGNNYHNKIINKTFFNRSLYSLLNLIICC